MLIDDDTFERIFKKHNIDIFAEDDMKEEAESIDDPVEPVSFEKKYGFFTKLFTAITVGDLLAKSKKKNHNGKYNDDCANCLPHYGYRYGGWYYDMVVSLTETKAAVAVINSPFNHFFNRKLIYGNTSQIPPEGFVRCCHKFMQKNPHWSSKTNPYKNLVIYNGR